MNNYNFPEKKRKSILLRALLEGKKLFFALSGDP
jgi:hypothetical protein